jgi:hydroxymethylbilane synthase
MHYLDNNQIKFITVAARPSPLSKIQVQEILKALQFYHPTIEFKTTYFETTGDVDQETSLRELDKTNFFTKEIDEALLNNQCRIGIHSAKDLPDPIPKGLKLICRTKGLDPRDALVLRSGETLDSLPKNALIATSSLRRELIVRQLRQDLTFRDLRGTISQRLALLEQKQADGIVVAEAALIRLGLTDLNRIILPGETIEGQGQLAVLARQFDEEMQTIFACLDVRN